MGIFEKINRLFGEQYETPSPNPHIDDKVHVPVKDSEDELDTSEHEADALFASKRQKRKGKKSNSEILNGDLWGSTFCIEYRDANGNESFRRIMMYHFVRYKTGDVILSAQCLERNALRHFRFDRIRSIVDDDGEAHDPILYFEIELSVDIVSYLTAGNTNDEYSDIHSQPSEAQIDKPGVLQRNVCRDGLRVLVAISRSDGDYHPSEIAEVLNYIVSESRVAGINTTEDDKAALLAYLKLQRPDKKTLQKCLSKLEERSPETRKRLFLAAEKVVLADGKIHSNEISFLQKITL